MAAGVDHADVLSAFCDWVLTFREKLPNILADEKLKHLAPSVNGWVTANVVSIKAHYNEGRVEYSDYAINGKPTTKTLPEMKGSWSTGELGSALEGVLSDMRFSKFKFIKRTTLEDHPVIGFEFEVKREANGSWQLQTTGNKIDIPGYKGHIWIEESTLHLMQFDRVSMDVDPKFPIKVVSAITRYENVSLRDGTSFVLPVSSRSMTCMTSLSANRYGNCMRSEIIFENWRKFGSEHRIMSDQPTIETK